MVWLHVAIYDESTKKIIFNRTSYLSCHSLCKVGNSTTMVKGDPTKTHLFTGKNDDCFLLQSKTKEELLCHILLMLLVTRLRFNGI